MTPARVIEIDGSTVRDIASLYAELDRVLMPAWTGGGARASMR